MQPEEENTLNEAYRRQLKEFDERCKYNPEYACYRPEGYQDKFKREGVRQSTMGEGVYGEI